MLTASGLFIGQEQSGEHRCFYCGSFCGSDHKAKDYVKDTFTNRDIVRFPGSGYVCRGCVESLGAGSDEITMVDGTIRPRTSPRGMQPRMFSWVLSKTGNLAATKAHISQLREIILSPPEPPFAIILADSGQKQLIFRAPVAWDRGWYPLLLEDMEIMVDTERLREYLVTAMQFCAATGKPALMEAEQPSLAIRIYDYYESSDPWEAWVRIYQEPLARLAAWLCPNKEDSQNEYPGVERGEVPARNGGSNRPKRGTADRGQAGDQGELRQADCDFGVSVRG